MTGGPLWRHHVDGLGREAVLVLAHQDGHVGLIAANGITGATVHQLAQLYEWTGVTGWSVRYTGMDAAVAAYIAGQTCRSCMVVFGCGCSWQRVGHRQCQHGTGVKLHRLAHVAGYCTNDASIHQGPPEPEYQRLYQPGSRVVHLAVVGAEGHPVVCRDPGSMWSAADWYGLQTQRQQQVAAKLPVCAACRSAVAAGRAVERLP